jgi:hypothetical protein
LELRANDTSTLLLADVRVTAERVTLGLGLSDRRGPYCVYELERVDARDCLADSDCPEGQNCAAGDAPYGVCQAPPAPPAP